jgi:pyruvate kinase
MQIAMQLEARLLIVASATGKSALSLSKERGTAPTVGVADNLTALRRMCLYWGVIPLPGAPTHDDRKLLDHIIQLGRSSGDLSPGDRLVLLSGTGLPTSRHNMIMVHEVD